MYKFSLKKKIQVKKSSQLFDVRLNSTNSDMIAVGTVEGDVIIYDLKDESSEPCRRLKRHHKGSSIRKILFDSSGKLVTAAKTIKIYDLESSEVIKTLKRNVDTQARLYSMMMLSDDIICAGDDEGSFLAWDTRRNVDQPIMCLKYSEEYLSGMDMHEDGNTVLTTSQDSTLTAFDIRKRKKLDPQSETFDAGFQCIKYVSLNQKAVIGAEDGTIYIFNNEEWGYPSSKFPVAKDSQRSKGKCSIDCIEMLSGTLMLAGCSDGKLKLVNLYPHKVVKDCVYSHKTGLEAMHLLTEEKILATCEESSINILTFDENGATSDTQDMEDGGDSADSDDDSSDDYEEEKQNMASKKPRSNFFAEIAE